VLDYDLLLSLLYLEHALEKRIVFLRSQISEVALRSIPLTWRHTGAYSPSSIGLVSA